MTPASKAYVLSITALVSTGAGAGLMFLLKRTPESGALWGVVSFDLALLGVITGVAGLFTSRSSIVPSLISGVAVALALPLAYVGLLGAVFIFVPGHI
jgi:hypothetical protein